jgi:hypothetical protein
MSHYENYTREFTKLSLWYARKHILEGLSDFEDALIMRVNIFRNTQFFVGGRHPSKGDVIPEWDALLDRLRTVFDAHIEDSNTATLEEKGLEIFWPDIKASIDASGDPQVPKDDRPYESWSCDHRSERLNIHIFNTYAPESPLTSKKDAFAGALIRLIEDSKRTHPKIDIVSCGSWLNSVSSFADLFPKAWSDSAKGSQEVRYTMGHWGQFTDRKGDFHARNGQQFRRTGEFPYEATSCQAPIDAVLDHLYENFPGGVSHNVTVGYDALR